MRDRTRAPTTRARNPQLDRMRKNRRESRRVRIAGSWMSPARRAGRAQPQLRSARRASPARRPLSGSLALHPRNQLPDASLRCAGFRKPASHRTVFARWRGPTRSSAPRVWWVLATVRAPHRAVPSKGSTVRLDCRIRRREHAYLIEIKRIRRFHDADEPCYAAAYHGDSSPNCSSSDIVIEQRLR